MTQSFVLRSTVLLLLGVGCAAGAVTHGSHDDAGNGGTTGQDAGGSGGGAGGGASDGGRGGSGGSGGSGGAGGASGAGGATDAGGSGGGSGSGSTPKSPDCTPFIETERAGVSLPYPRLLKPPHSVEELWCHLNQQRSNYSVHGRQLGCIPADGFPDDKTRTKDDWPLTWPWDPGANAIAQTEAERIAAGGSPPGRDVGTPNGFRNYWVVCGSPTEYQIATTGDRDEMWPDFTKGYIGPESDSMGSTMRQLTIGRLDFFYHGGQEGLDLVPKRIGVGMVDDGKGSRVWVAKLLP